MYNIFHFFIIYRVVTAKYWVSICHQVCSHLPSSPCPGSIPSANYYFVLCIYMFVFVWFVHLFYFILFFFFGFFYSTYEWNQVVFVFVWLISLSIMPSRSICVPQVARLLFFYGWVVCNLCVCITSSLSTHLLRGT